MTQEATSATFYFTSGAEDARHGPYTGPQLKQLAKQGILKPTDIIWQAGSSKTTPAAKVKGLFAAAEAAPAPIPQAPVAVPVAAPAVAVGSTGPFAAVTPFGALPAKMESPPVLAEMVYEAEVVGETKPTNPVVGAVKSSPTAWLEDPMREISVRFGGMLRKLFFASLAITAVLLIPYFLISEGLISTLLGMFLYYLWILFYGYLTNLVWWRAFAPRRTTDVFYLRSFRKDQQSWPVRVAMQEALGDHIRVSGIRDPRRRVTPLSDGLSPWLKAMRHCTPKFMDLEAETGWKSRLWNSLQHGKMAVVDLSDITPHVYLEMRLVTRAIGIDRTIFLGSAPQSIDELRQIVASQLDAEVASRARIMIWPSDPGAPDHNEQKRIFRENFKHAFLEIAAREPIPQHPVPPEYVEEDKGTRPVPMSRTMISWMIGLQLLLIGIQVLLTLASKGISSDPKIQNLILLAGSFPILLVNGGFFLWNFFVYVRDVGIFRRRVRAIILFVVLVLPLGPVLRQLLLLNEPGIDPRTMPTQSEMKEDAALLEAEAGANG